MNLLKENKEWSQATDNVFWGEIAPCEHVVQIYENDEVFLDLLGGFVIGGLKNGECVIVIATGSHLKSLNKRLEEQGINLIDIMLNDQYIPLDATDTLSKFMIGDWPDENLFYITVSDLIARAKKQKRQVRAFGEMVAILWAKGNEGATVRLEHLWNKFAESEAFSLFCAYPKSGFTQDANESLMHICGAHSKMIAGVGKGTNEIFYQAVDKKKAG
jgi:hypothetical protein